MSMKREIKFGVASMELITSMSFPSSSLSVSKSYPSGTLIPYKLEKRWRCRQLSRPTGLSICRLGILTSKCSLTNGNVHLDHIAMFDEVQERQSSTQHNCSSLPSVHLTSNDPWDILKEESNINSEEEQTALAATPAHPGGLYALYASCFVGNLVEQVWNFTCPAAVALLHPSLLPVAVIGFFAKLSIFITAPAVGNLMDHFPRISTYNSLCTIQMSAQLLSVMMVIHAFNTALHASASVVLVQPWFIALVIAGAVERIAGLALGVTIERDWVVLLAGANRPTALAQANAMLFRINLICEIVGALLFGFLLTTYDTVTCLKVASLFMMCALPILIILGQLINKLSNGVLDCCKVPHISEPSFCAEFIISAIKDGWTEYKLQPVLPASISYVLLFFNIALAPGAIMTAFLTYHRISPSIIGGFGGLCAFMGIGATFISADLVKKLGILKTAAAGLVFQATLLTIAVLVVCSCSISSQKPLFLFLSLIVLSRLGQMSYEVVGIQILQNGISVSKANLIGAMEISIASLAEFLMLGVAMVAKDVTHFSFLAVLSVSSVVVAAWMFCQWLANPTDEQRNLFSFDPRFI